MNKKCSKCNTSIGIYDPYYIRVRFEVPLYYCSLNCYYGVIDSNDM